jgi:hypothetical protein
MTYSRDKGEPDGVAELSLGRWIDTVTASVLETVK